MISKIDIASFFLFSGRHAPPFKTGMVCIFLKISVYIQYVEVWRASRGQLSFNPRRSHGNPVLIRAFPFRIKRFNAKLATKLRTALLAGYKNNALSWVGPIRIDWVYTPHAPIAGGESRNEFE